MFRNKRTAERHLDRGKQAYWSNETLAVSRGSELSPFDTPTGMSGVCRYYNATAYPDQHPCGISKFSLEVRTKCATSLSKQQQTHSPLQ